MSAARAPGQLDEEMAVDIRPDHATAHLDIELCKVIWRSEPETIVPRRALLSKCFSKHLPIAHRPSIDQKHVVVEVEVDPFIEQPELGFDLLQINPHHQGEGVIFDSSRLEQQVGVERSFAVVFRPCQQVQDNPL